MFHAAHLLLYSWVAENGDVRRHLHRRLRRRHLPHLATESCDVYLRLEASKIWIEIWKGADGMTSRDMMNDAVLKIWKAFSIVEIAEVVSAARYSLLHGFAMDAVAEYRRWNTTRNDPDLRGVECFS